MAILRGQYSPDDLIRRSYPNPDGTPHPPLDPERVRVTATPQEWGHIGALPAPAEQPVWQSKQIIDHQQTDGTCEREEHVTRDIPPDRELVRHIARKVEVQVPDEALIDWMSRGEEK